MVSIVNNKIKMMIMQFQIQQKKRFQNTIVSSLNRSYSETTLVLKIDIYNEFLICYTSTEFLEIFFTASNHNSSRCFSVDF